MEFTLYTAVVEPMRRTLGNVGALLDLAQVQMDKRGMTEADVIGARLAPDMLPFAYQIKSTAVHSLGAIEALRKGVFSPDMTDPGDSFAALAATVKHADDGLAVLDPAEVNGFVGRPMVFAFRTMHADFTAESFLTTFSLPNFYFHATTAYDILRHKGMTLGKGHYIGKMNFRPA